MLNLNKLECSICCCSIDIDMHQDVAPKIFERSVLFLCFLSPKFNAYSIEKCLASQIFLIDFELG